MSSVPFVLIRNDKQVSDCGLQVLLDPVHKGQQEGQCNFPQPHQPHEILMHVVFVVFVGGQPAKMLGFAS